MLFSKVLKAERGVELSGCNLESAFEGTKGRAWGGCEWRGWGGWRGGLKPGWWGIRGWWWLSRRGCLFSEIPPKLGGGIPGLMERFLQAGCEGGKGCSGTWCCCINAADAAVDNFDVEDDDDDDDDDEDECGSDEGVGNIMQNRVEK